MHNIAKRCVKYDFFFPCSNGFTGLALLLVVASVRVFSVSSTALSPLAYNSKIGAMPRLIGFR